MLAPAVCFIWAAWRNDSKHLPIQVAPDRQPQQNNLNTCPIVAAFPIPVPKMMLAAAAKEERGVLASSMASLSEFVQKVFL